MGILLGIVIIVLVVSLFKTTHFKKDGTPDRRYLNSDGLMDLVKLLVGGVILVLFLTICHVATDPELKKARDAEANKVQPTPTPTATPLPTPTPLPKPVSPPSVSPALTMPWEIDNVLRYRGGDVRFVLIWGAVNVLFLLLSLALLLGRKIHRIHMPLSKYIHEGHILAWIFMLIFSLFMWVVWILFILFYPIEKGEYQDAGEYEKAISYWNVDIYNNPSDHKNFNERGFLYSLLGQYEEAIEDYTEAIRLDPNYARAYNNRGFSYYNLGEYEKSIEDYSKGIELNPNNARAYHNRGYMYGKLGNYDKAIEDYSKAIELNPNNPYGLLSNTYRYRADIYEELGEHEKAKADRAKAKELE